MMRFRSMHRAETAGESLRQKSDAGQMLPDPGRKRQPDSLLFLRADFDYFIFQTFADVDVGDRSDVAGNLTILIVIGNCGGKDPHGCSIGLLKAILRAEWKAPSNTALPER